ncbi:hypothetical protein CKAH01_14110 [Colletotrichum kahawae]|uniref:Uncharacterized protein n=1 Tax=Colletotrichum kahawae TaxID=34407 RepID=A0AAD9YPP2_COLKA|nr:hypothetical protein CKAH01_14110 [Colletotrichum kahawae]
MSPQSLLSSPLHRNSIVTDSSTAEAAKLQNERTEINLAKENRRKATLEALGHDCHLEPPYPLDRPGSDPRCSNDRPSKTRSTVDVVLCAPPASASRTDSGERDSATRYSSQKA